MDSLSNEQRELVESFRVQSNESEKCALFYLEAYDWNYDEAVQFWSDSRPVIPVKANVVSQKNDNNASSSSSSRRKNDTPISKLPNKIKKTSTKSEIDYDVYCIMTQIEEENDNDDDDDASDEDYVHSDKSSSNSEDEGDSLEYRAIRDLEPGFTGCIICKVMWESATPPFMSLGQCPCLIKRGIGQDSMEKRSTIRISALGDNATFLQKCMIVGQVYRCSGLVFKRTNKWYNSTENNLEAFVTEKSKFERLDEKDFPSHFHDLEMLFHLKPIKFLVENQGNVNIDLLAVIKSVSGLRSTRSGDVNCTVVVIDQSGFFLQILTWSKLAERLQNQEGKLLLIQGLRVMWKYGKRTVTPMRCSNHLVEEEIPEYVPEKKEIKDWVELGGVEEDFKPLANANYDPYADYTKAKDEFISEWEKYENSPASTSKPRIIDTARKYDISYQSFMSLLHGLGIHVNRRVDESKVKKVNNYYDRQNKGKRKNEKISIQEAIDYFSDCEDLVPQDIKNHRKKNKLTSKRTVDKSKVVKVNNYFDRQNKGKRKNEKISIQEAIDYFSDCDELVPQDIKNHRKKNKLTSKRTVDKSKVVKVNNYFDSHNQGKSKNEKISIQEAIDYFSDCDELVPEDINNHRKKNKLTSKRRVDKSKVVKVNNYFDSQNQGKTKNEKISLQEAIDYFSDCDELVPKDINNYRRNN